MALLIPWQHGRVHSSLSRRLLLAAPVAALAGCAGGAAPSASSRPAATTTATPSAPTWVMPDEGARHTATWMSFGASEEIWGDDLLATVRRNLADIANAIVRFEPVKMLVRPDEAALARTMVDPAVSLVPLPVDDLWVRDSGPVFVAGAGASLGGVGFNFNGWGNRQEHRRDALVAAAVTEAAAATAVTTELTLEGGALEVDGLGTAIITESCVLNENRNPGWSKADVEAELGRLLGVRKIIWLPGIAGRDITDGHTDFYARFASPGRVLAALDDDPASFDYEVTRAHLEILRSATDADGRRLEVTTLTAPSAVRATHAGEDFAAGYINFYLCNGGLIAPQFGDRRADAAARDALARLFGDRRVVQLNVDGIAAGGGGIHCSTQQQPAL